jgi:hypothetical protein
MCMYVCVCVCVLDRVMPTADVSVVHMSTRTEASLFASHPHQSLVVCLCSSLATTSSDAVRQFAARAPEYPTFTFIVICLEFSWATAHQFLTEVGMMQSDRVIVYYGGSPAAGAFSCVCVCVCVCAHVCVCISMRMHVAMCSVSVFVHMNVR